MKKLLLIFLYFPIIFSCERKDNKIIKLEDRIKELEEGLKIIKKEKENDYNKDYKKLNKKADDLKKKEFYISNIKSDSIEQTKLKSNIKEQEKFARERFLIKKDNEDILIIRKNEDE